MLKIDITGHRGSGKTTVANLIVKSLPDKLSNAEIHVFSYHRQRLSHAEELTLETQVNNRGKKLVIIYDDPIPAAQNSLKHTLRTECPCCKDRIAVDVFDKGNSIKVNKDNIGTPSNPEPQPGPIYNPFPASPFKALTSFPNSWSNWTNYVYQNPEQVLYEQGRLLSHIKNQIADLQKKTAQHDEQLIFQKGYNEGIDGRVTQVEKSSVSAHKRITELDKDFSTLIRQTVGDLNKLGTRITNVYQSLKETTANFIHDIGLLKKQLDSRSPCPGLGEPSVTFTPENDTPAKPIKPRIITRLQEDATKAPNPQPDIPISSYSTLAVNLCSELLSGKIEGLKLEIGVQDLKSFCDGLEKALRKHT